MTNTGSAAPAITFEQMATLSLRNAEFRAETVRAEIAERVAIGDYSYMVRHMASSAVKIEYRVGVLQLAVKHGPEALVARIASGLNESTSYSSEFSNGAGQAIQDEARALLREFRELLTPEEVVFLVSRLY